MSRIVIDGDSGKITFYKGDQVVMAPHHMMAIRFWPCPVRKVRYLFTAEGDSQGAPKHIQFSWPWD